MQFPEENEDTSTPGIDLDASDAGTTEKDLPQDLKTKKMAMKANVVETPINPTG